MQPAVPAFWVRSPVAARASPATAQPNKHTTSTERRTLDRTTHIPSGGFLALVCARDPDARTRSGPLHPTRGGGHPRRRAGLSTRRATARGVLRSRCLDTCLVTPSRELRGALRRLGGRISGHSGGCTWHL